MAVKNLKRKAAAGAGFGAVLFLIACWIAGNVLSAPARRVVGDLPPELAGHSVQFQSDSGATLYGWLLPGRKGAGAILLMHGFRASRLDMLERARFLSSAGYAVLLFDFQAHGESTGDVITTGYLESRDARAALEFLRANAAGEKIGIVGVSMGGAATLLSEPPLRADAIVLEMVYPTIEQAISNRLTLKLGGWASVLTPLLTVQLKLRGGISANQLHPIANAGRVVAPKLFIAGSEDQHTTLDESRELFAAAAEPKELWVLEGAKHVDAHAFAAGEYERRVLLFFEQHIRR
jgi:fermentation-respiration switch protein FrsA (DUF1100 family)